MSKVQAVRGMNDILPEESALWQWFESHITTLLASYGYQEIRLPALEKTELFKRTMGEITDVVEKEMYTFEDRNGDSLSLRPEGTAGCVRAGIEHGLLHNQIQKLWYMGPMFRHERPQKGRYRQFMQLGVETFGAADAMADAELIALSARLWRHMGVQEHVTLLINTLGTSEERRTYREQLVAYFTPLKAQLDEECQRRLETNPMRILDSKNPDMQVLVKDAPKLLDALSTESRNYFDRVCEILDSIGIAYEVRPTLVRGLDYYTHTVFEWVTDALGAQGTICAGGRYDGLVEQLGGRSTPAVGLAMGIERLLLLVQAIGAAPEQQPNADIYWVLSGDEAQSQGMALAEQLRSSHPQLASEVHIAGGSFKSQFKRADKSGATLAVVMGEDEAKARKVIVKYLREDREQDTVAQSELPALLNQYFGKH